MALAPVAPSPTVLVAGRARRLEIHAGTTTIVLDDDRRLDIAGVPDQVGARRCRQSLNHIGSVRIEGSLDQVAARVRGLGNRLPVDLAVPVATALALIQAGVPAIVRLADDLADPSFGGASA